MKHGESRKKLGQGLVIGQVTKLSSKKDFGLAFA